MATVSEGPVLEPPMPTAAAPLDAAARLGKLRPVHGVPAFDILVLDACTRQSLAVTRSLGRQGLRVAVAECFVDCDPRLPVLSFSSRYARETAVMHSFAESPDGFADDVVAFVRRHPTRVILPGSDGAVAAVRSRRGELALLGCTLALPEDSSLDVANDKERTLAAARPLGLDQPRSRRVSTLAELPDAIAAIGFPLVLKPVRSWSEVAQVRIGAVECINAAEATAAAADLLRHGVPALAQEWVGGAREGVTLFVVDGVVHGAFAHEEIRTTPALGGASAVRRSIPLPVDLFDASVRLVTSLRLDGLSGVEFRRDAEGRPRLMEINARPAGTMEIALACGVDFPRMLWEWATGQPVHFATTYRAGVRMRWLRGDMRWLRDNHHRVGRPDSVARSRAAAMFLAEFVLTRRLDAVDLFDLAPAWAELRAIAAGVRSHSGSAQLSRRDAP